MSHGVEQILLVAAADEAEVLHEPLTDAGYRVAAAHDLTSATALLARLEVPAVVVLDDSADGDMVAFLVAMRRARPADLHRIPVVLLSGADAYAPAGIAEVMAKPVLAPLLVEVVQRLLERA